MATPEKRFADNGARIRKAREAMRPYCSQERFAPLIGTSRRHLMRLEGGYHLPRKGMRDRIVDVTGTDEQIKAADDEEEDMLKALAAALKRLQQHRRLTGDPRAVCR